MGNTPGHRPYSKCSPPRTDLWGRKTEHKPFLNAKRGGRLDWAPAPFRVQGYVNPVGQFHITSVSFYQITKGNNLKGNFSRVH